MLNIFCNSFSRKLSSFITRSFSVSRCIRMELQDVISKLESFAPLSLAEKWDNVGLLVQPSGSHKVHSVLLTNDLTERVLHEAIEKKVQMVISYHPPIFVPLKRLTSNSFKERIIVKAIEERIAIYSPHTAFDAVHNGVNDWLASGLGEGVVTPLQYSMAHSTQNCTNKVVVAINSLDAKKAAEIENSMQNSGKVMNFSIDKKMSYNDSVKHDITWLCSDNNLLQTINMLSQTLNSVSSDVVSKLEVQALLKVPIHSTGSGRLCKLTTPVQLDTLVSRIKNHLQLKHVRLAISHTDMSSTEISSIALCAGSGASVLKGVKADVYLTGEMSHHEVLEAVSNGSHVILCEHSNTERGFLQVFKDKLHSFLSREVEIIVSSKDSDPLEVV